MNYKSGYLGGKACKGKFLEFRLNFEFMSVSSHFKTLQWLRILCFNASIVVTKYLSQNSISSILKVSDLCICTDKNLNWMIVTTSFIPVANTVLASIDLGQSWRKNRMVRV